MAASASQSTAADAITPASRLWRAAKRLGRGAFVLGATAYVGAGLYAVGKQYASFLEYVTLPSAFYLELDLETCSLVERARGDALASLLGGGGACATLELASALKALDEAKRDARVRGLLALLGARERLAGLAQVQELRSAVLDFRLHARGRAPAVAYSNTLGEGGTNATALAYLASAFDQAYVAPTGMYSLLGFDGTAVFYKRLLDKVGLRPAVFRREEYKAAMAAATGDAYDPYHRANTESLLGDMADQVISGIAAGRRLDAPAVAAAMAEAPLSTKRAAELGLLDGTAHRDEVEGQLAARVAAAAAAGDGGSGGGKGVLQSQQKQQPPPHASMPDELRRNPLTGGPSVGAARYLASLSWERLGSLRSRAAAAAAGAVGGGTGSSASAGAPADAQQPAGRKRGGGGGAAQQPQQPPAVVVVSALGAIVQTAPPGGGPGPLGGGGRFVESARLVRALRQLRRMEHVKAVVLRVNSPGGSAVASDAIHRELVLLREAGKPVIASMGDVAASGGYYIAAPCSRILAQPGTITGSIGVIMSKVDASEAAGHVGITSDTVKVGANADWASPFTALSAEQAAAVDAHVEATYSDFISRVADGRGMSHEAVRALAKGRVYSGRQALELGLVDEIGGIAQAIDAAKTAAGLPVDDPSKVQLLEWPPRRVPPALALLKSAGVLPAPDADPLPAPPPPAAAVAWRVVWDDARAMLDLFLYGPDGAGWDAWSGDGSGIGGSSSGIGMPGFLRRALGGSGDADAAAAAAVAAAAGSAALQADPEVAAAVALLRALPRGARAALAAVAAGGLSHRGPQYMCMEAEALAMSC